MADDITDDVLDAILRESDGFWPPARERIQALIREHDAALIESLVKEAARESDEGRKIAVGAWWWLLEKARELREGVS